MRVFICHKSAVECHIMKQIRDNELLRNIAVRLKQLRDRKHVSQETVYSDTQIHIARIETARVNVSISTLAALCRYFGVSLSEFFKDM